MANILINQGTQTAIANDTIGTVYYQTVKLDIGAAGVSNLFTGTLPAITNLGAGTITKVEGGTIQTNLLTGTITALPNLPGGTLDRIAGGTITSITGGNIVVTASTQSAGTVNTSTVNTGTINTGTINVATITGGTLTRLNTIGTLEVGTITTLPNIPGGTLAVVTTVSNITNGSMVVTAGTVAAHAITAATITEGTLRNLISGTINAATVVLNSGTISVLPNLPQGSINVTAGTFRLNPSPTVVSSSYGTTTTGTIGTLVAAPSAGSAIFITCLEVSQQSGTAEEVISFGLAAQGQQVISRGNYVAGGGIVKSFAIPNSGNATGTALTFNMLSGSGTVSYTVSYFVAIP